MKNLDILNTNPSTNFFCFVLRHLHSPHSACTIRDGKNQVLETHWRSFFSVDKTLVSFYLHNRWTQFQIKCMNDRKYQFLKNTVTVWSLSLSHWSWQSTTRGHLPLWNTSNKPFRFWWPKPQPPTFSWQQSAAPQQPWCSRRLCSTSCWCRLTPADAPRQWKLRLFLISPLNRNGKYALGCKKKCTLLKDPNATQRTRRKTFQFWESRAHSKMQHHLTVCFNRFFSQVGSLVPQ